MLVARAALADNPSVAQALFEDGKRLMSEGNTSAACAKFAESQRLDPAGGTLMNLAACHMKEGKTASAWAEFKDALAEANRQGRTERSEEAARRIAELTPQLARIEVVVDGARAKDMRVTLDDVVIGPASWNIPVPVDPGSHELRASAPGYAAVSVRRQFAAAATERVVLPPLAPAPVAEGGAEAPEAPEARAKRPLVAAFVTGGVALASLGVGIAFGIRAADLKSSSNGYCTSAGCTSDGATLLRDANVSAWVANVTIGVAVAGAVVAAILFAIKPGASPPRPIALALDALGAGLAW